MAPMLPTRSKRSKADVIFAFPLIVSTIDNAASQVFPTLPQGMPMPTVPRPLSHIIPSGTEHNPNNLDPRFGFNLPPRFHGRDTPGPPLVADASEIPIDPVLLAESQFQSSRRPPQVVYHSSSSQVHQGPMPLLPDTGDQSKGQATGIDIYTGGILGSDGSGDDSEDDKADESGAGYEHESDSSNSSDNKLEYDPLSRPNAYHTSFPVNTHEHHDPILGAFHFCEISPSLHLVSTVPGFDQSPSEDERFAQAQLRFSSTYLIKSHYLTLS